MNLVHRCSCFSLIAALGLVTELTAEGAMLPDSSPRYEESFLDSLSVQLEPGSGRPYLFSGIGTSFFYGSTETAASDGWMGWHDGDLKLLDDWIFVVDGIPRDRARAVATIYPCKAVFRWPDGVTLTVASIGEDRDDLRFTANLHSVKPDPALAITEPEQRSTALFFVFPSSVTIEKAYLNKARGMQYYLGISGRDSLFMAVGSRRWFETPEMRSVESDREGPYSIHRGKAIHGVMFDEAGFDLVFSWGSSAQAAGDRCAEIRDSDFVQQEQRRQWLLSELNRSYFHCENKRINQAVNWAKLSLAGLFAEDETLLWAGLPWFHEGWARDTFISLPGACLVSGKFGVAASILNRFAQWQNHDPDSPDYGKVPNRARAGEIIYNTADGTPWFIRELYEYGLYSGDRELWREFAEPGGVIERTITGALEHRVDEQGFLTHGDADTWMDAVGTDGPWSPRGNRAVEVQALWLAQLQAAEWMLRDAGREISFENPRAKLIDSFREMFIRKDGLGLVDHLNADGSQDLKIRPNQLFAITVPLSSSNPLLSPAEQARIVSVVRDSLVYPWGVASLAQTDPDFHPYHQTPEYPKDAAYHNGIIWTWLSGPCKSASKAGWGVAEYEIRQILDRGCVGTLSENLDALPRANASDPNTSGTISQAWSLAEFLRTLYQDFLGIRPKYDVPGAWEFDPRLPVDIGDVDAVVWLDGQPVRYQCDISETQVQFRLTALTPDNLIRPIQLRLFSSVLDTTDTIRDVSGELNSKAYQWTLTLYREQGGTFLRIPAGPMLPAFQSVRIPLFISARDDEPFLQPRALDGIQSLRPPPWPMLPGDLVTAWNEKAPVAKHADDREGDDTGVTEDRSYAYPSDTMFHPGILDITGLTIRSDGALACFALSFRNLVDPGWHPEYGFQLTFATLAIRTGVEGRKLSTSVGRNSGYDLPQERAADRFIHIGGGFEIEDGEKTIMAAFVPESVKHKLGDAGSRTIRFAVPLEFLGGDPPQWVVTVTAGAQDDHGGGGIGDYRQVTREGGRWTGSGAEPSDPNVYDVLFVP